ncbi:MAG TPA: hypothetical protein VL984_03575 [Acidimicrobiales bacterium]|nr:hypothetical protein [Acidimicrobiales bacterium]
MYVAQFTARTLRYPYYLVSTSESLVEQTSATTGDRSTMLHYPSSYENLGKSFLVGRNRVGVGRLVSVLVDPKDREYAEFPGFPVVGGSAWVVPLLFCLAACAPMALVAKSLARQLRHGLRHHSRPYLPDG